MSATYKPVGWTRTKLVYDGVLIIGICLYIVAYTRLAQPARPTALQLDEASLLIRAYGTCAFILLSLVLCIGPLVRLDRRFVPLLYNRRHFGVITCLVAAAHLMAVLDWYLAFSPLDPWVALFAVDSRFDALRGLPYVPFGIAAFVILLLLAATSHDFWLNFLTPPVWKALHMSIYAAYGLVVVHVAFGALQDARGATVPALICGSAVIVMSLHIVAGWKERQRETQSQARQHDATWVMVGPVNQLPEGRGLVVTLPSGETAAVFRHDGGISATSNLCAHQNGPLGEGRVRNGRIICPWHGYEYCVRNGRAPAPYTEKIATYRVKIVSGQILIDPVANPPGTSVDPAALSLEGRS
jgi:nitrite reductase/ring-hydroxylating ferredoxin subunit/DMSO/TMAO reductase YedYZ heme-binding membrane subunit